MMKQFKACGDYVGHVAQMSKRAVKHAATKGNATVIAAVGTAVASLPASAAIVLEDVETKLQAAQTQGESVGTIIIGVVAALVVVGIIIGMVKKL